jgi:hypothetical protein
MFRTLASVQGVLSHTAGQLCSVRRWILAGVSLSCWHVSGAQGLCQAPWGTQPPGVLQLQQPRVAQADSITRVTAPSLLVEHPVNRRRCAASAVRIEARLCPCAAGPWHMDFRCPVDVRGARALLSGCSRVLVVWMASFLPRTAPRLIA